MKRGRTNHAAVKTPGGFLKAAIQSTSMFTASLLVNVTMFHRSPSQNQTNCTFNNWLMSSYLLGCSLWPNYYTIVFFCDLDISLRIFILFTSVITTIIGLLIYLHKTYSKHIQNICRQDSSRLCNNFELLPLSFVSWREERYDPSCSNCLKTFRKRAIRLSVYKRLKHNVISTITSETNILGVQVSIKQTHNR